MSLDSIGGSVQSLGNTLSSGLNTVGRLGSDLGGGGSTPTYWKDRLRPATFRGVPFGVLEGQIKFGRSIAVHEYPFRDGVWVEDMGRSARRVSFSAFLVGDDCIAQRDRLIKACEDADAVNNAELVHPTLGRLTVSLADDVTSIERWDRGRLFEIGFSFIEQGKRIYPTSAPATGDVVATQAAAAKSAVSSDFLSSVAGALKTGAAAALQAVSTVQSWVRSAQKLVNDATNLYHFVQSLPGEFGRLFGGNTVRSVSSATSVQSLIALGAAGRTNVALASSTLSSAAAGLVAVSGSSVALAGGQVVPVAASSPGFAGNGAATNTPIVVAAAVTAYSSAAHALAGAIAAAAPAPTDALRLLSGLIAQAPALPAGLTAPTYPIAQAFATPPAQAASIVAGSSSDLFRRAGLIAMAQASAIYQPVSHDDAAAVLASVTQQLDAEIVIAGDQGADQTYNALRALRTAVVQDLTQRGAALAGVVQVSTPLPVPALVLAQRLYRDAGRADELIAEANPIHPAFMPPQFKALAR